MKGVYLVGAGPGDKDLITVRGRKLLEQADVIVYDNLANPALLAYRKENCECIYVGKKSNDHTLTQDKINDLLVTLGKKHDCVVRLKGGDPYVFGRGREEGESLRAAGIHFEVVPGITSAIGGLCYAGIPITSRNIATSFHVITGHISDKSTPIDFEYLAKLKGTLVFLMGVKNLPTIVEELSKHGMNSDMPVAIIYKASTPEQKVFEGKLDNIVDIAVKEQVKPPSLIVVGEVVKHREALSFFENRPLFGQHILVTRSRANHSKMSDQLIDLGAKVTVLPTIHIKKQEESILSDALDHIEKFDHIVFSSGVAVEIFFDQLKEKGKDVRYLSGQKFIVVGDETKKILSKHGIIADYVPKTFNLEGITDILKEICLESKPTLLIPRSAKGDKKWLSSLKDFADVTEVLCYDTELIEHKTIEDVDPLDYVTFTSSSTVHGFMNQLKLNDQLKQVVKQAKLVAIGPATKQTLESYGYQANLQPERYTIKNMVDVIRSDAERKSHE